MGGSLAGCGEQCCAHVAWAMGLLGVPFSISLEGKSRAAKKGGRKNERR